MSFLKRPQPDHARNGARQVLAGLGEIPAIRLALGELEAGIDLDFVSGRLKMNLQNWLKEHQARVDELERKLSHERFDRARFEAWYEEYRNSPLQQELDKARAEVAVAHQRRKSAEEARQRYLQALEQRRQEIEQLQKQILELNRVIARQHDKLQDLLGPEQP